MSPEWRARLARVSRWLAAWVPRLGFLLFAVARGIWWRLGSRARVAVVLATLLLIAAATNSVEPALSATAQALAVLLVAFLGLWLIVTSPFSR